MHTVIFWIFEVTIFTHDYNLGEGGHILDI